MYPRECTRTCDSWPRVSTGLPLRPFPMKAEASHSSSSAPLHPAHGTARTAGSHALARHERSSFPSPAFRISQVRTMASKSSLLPKPRSAPGKHCRHMANWERHGLCFRKMNKSQRSSTRPAANRSVLRALGFPGGASCKEPTCQRKRCKQPEFSPWVGRPPGGGHGNPL